MITYIELTLSLEKLISFAIERATFFTISGCISTFSGMVSASKCTCKEYSSPSELTWQDEFIRQIRFKEVGVEHWHEICNHTAHHDKYFKTWVEAERFESELLWWERDVKAVLWEEYLVRMKRDFPFFRFPWMHWIRVKAYLDILKDHGYIPIWWNYTTNPTDGIVNNGDIYLWHFNNRDTANVRKNLELILESDKQPKTVSDIITSEGYDEPIWWHNIYKKKKELKK